MTAATVSTSIDGIIGPSDQCGQVLLAVAEQLTTLRKEDLSADFLVKSREDFTKLSKDLTSIHAECEKVRSVLRNYQLQDAEELTLDSLEDGTSAAKRLKTSVDDYMSSLCVENYGQMNLIESVATVFSETDEQTVDEDDEIQIQETQDTAHSFICPVTQLQMNKPMKNVSQQRSCKHHIDENAVRQMLGRRQSFLCPLTGCSGLWQKGYIQHDKAFQYKLDRFKRLHSQT